ncbi:universal stress protein [Leptolyngbya iicbica]|uniref:Universal stress protein n=2 Tax=Cyanophyceae TaxID=3028117 RepID=A0A4Q7E7Q5_9CYAN|nr:universal stress protein [Leptolyngbya sp. LK]RZM78612.1 universal stress protein [Leptolyngbya sp. LK]
MPLFSSENVLVPIDFSDEAMKALKDTLEFVKDPAKVHALYVLSPLEATDPGVVWQTVDDDTRIAKIREMYAKHFPEEVYQKIKFTVEVGNPSSEIIDYAQSNGVDLIVIPSSGKTGLSRFFMGSVSEKVVRFSHCPVLVIRH